MPEQSSGSPSSSSSSTEATIDVLLCIFPAELERQFWEAPETQRLLRAMDILSVVMVVQNVLAAMQVRLLANSARASFRTSHATALGCINQG